jgi:hypothetical protein
MSDAPSSRSRLSRRALLAAGPVVGVGVGAGALATSSSASAAPGVVSIAYVEVNDNDLAVVGDYSLEGTSTPVFDLAIIFAANIDLDGSSAVLHFNDQVQATLDDAATQIRPLQERGIKVLLSVLPNHQGVGFANFPDESAARGFAQQLADAVEEYGLDGIDFDDEYAEYGANGTGQPNAHSFVDLVTALRELLGPDKLITFYNIGPSAERTDDGDRHAGDHVDYAWNPYYGTWAPPSITGMSKAQLSPAAVSIYETSADQSAEFARRTVDEGYGVFLTYNLGDQDASERISAFTRELYGASATRSS